ncbi:MAG: penicillin-binding transpeptidase domain-containing protein [Frankiaceae bacterium]
MSRRIVAPVLALVLLPLASCTSGPKPDRAARAFLAAWARGDDAAAGQATDAPATATAALVRTRKALGLTAGQLRLGRVGAKKDAATAAYSASWKLRALGDWAYDGTLVLRKLSGKWQVHWTPAALHPRLAAGQTLGRTRVLPPRADILDGTGKPLTSPTEVITVSILPSALTDRARTVALLGRVLGVDPRKLTAALAKAKPNELLPVIPLRRRDYDKVSARIHNVAGLRFPSTTRSLPPTPTFARAVLGRVGPATAEGLKAAGPAFQAGDDVGLGGIQAAFQQRLAGTPGGSVVIRDVTGAVASTLASFPAQPGSPVRTTLDRALQSAAEATLAPLTKPAAMVAVRPSDGAILAAANVPADSAFDRALAGHYAPGSTFKIVTTAALLGRGLRLDDAVRCPPSVSVEGKSFRNFEGEAAGALPFRRDFAISCNTAFVGLSSRLPGASLPDAARSLGVGAEWTLPLPSYAGSVPTPASAVERAADAIGQGKVTVSPLSMALVGAAVANGSLRPPVLVSDPKPSAPVSAPVAVPAAPQLRELMRLVVTSGTAAPAFRGYPGPPVSGKTGTAEFGTVNPPATHAWFVGFPGGRNLAFAVVVEGGGVGGAVAAPLAARFLQRLG